VLPSFICFAVKEPFEITLGKYGVTLTLRIDVDSSERVRGRITLLLSAPLQKCPDPLEFFVRGASGWKLVSSDLHIQEFSNCFSWVAFAAVRRQTSDFVSIVEHPGEAGSRFFLPHNRPMLC